MPRPAWLLLLMTIALAAPLGCTSPPPTPERPGDYQTVDRPPTRDPEAANAHFNRGLASIDAGDLEEAERHLKRALAADVDHGPAHNNLGRIYFQTGRLYLAAWEFRYAAKLMPAHPAPPNNLGLVHERAGQLETAITHYRRALDLAPDDIAAQAHLARALIRRDQEADRDEIHALLQRVAVEHPDEAWRAWAQRTLAMMPR